MSVIRTSLEALVLKATHEFLAQPDAAAIEAFFSVMSNNVEGPQMAAQALAARIYSPNACEALLTLTMLDRLMRRCDANFNAEIGKFRFLNELIKLVSPKYYADRTPSRVKIRILQMLQTWTDQYPKEIKFKVAFEMLKNQGVIKEIPPPLPPEFTNPMTRSKSKHAIFEDDEKSKLLKKLLQSKKPEDLQHANRLIKTMVREEERRSDANSRSAQEVCAALDNAGLLRDMLENSDDVSADEEQLIHELYSSCMRLRLVLEQLSTIDTYAENLCDILHANDVLEDVFNKYNKFVIVRRMKSVETMMEAQTKINSLLDFAGDNIQSSDTANKNNKSSIADTVMEELGDIFSNHSATNSDTNSATNRATNRAPNRTPNFVEPLRPVNLMSADDELITDIGNKAQGWNQLDTLGEQMLKASLPQNARRADNFINKLKKIPMNALEKSSPQNVVHSSNPTPAHNSSAHDSLAHGSSAQGSSAHGPSEHGSSTHASSAHGSSAHSPSAHSSSAHNSSAHSTALLDLDFFTAKKKKPKLSPAAGLSNAATEPDDLMVDISTDDNYMSSYILDRHNRGIIVTPVDRLLNLHFEESDRSPASQDMNTVIAEGEISPKVKSDDLKSLSDINVTLESVQPSKVPPLTAFEDKDGLTVVLHSCKDNPRPNVYVFVISTSSRNGSPIQDYKLQVIIPKGCKVRLLDASSTSLPAYNPFLPPPAITQLMLLSVPDDITLPTLNFVVTYTCEGDTCTEVGKISNLPLDNKAVVV